MSRNLLALVIRRNSSTSTKDIQLSSFAHQKISEIFAKAQQQTTNYNDGPTEQLVLTEFQKLMEGKTAINHDSLFTTMQRIPVVKNLPPAPPESLSEHTINHYISNITSYRYSLNLASRRLLDQMITILVKSGELDYTSYTNLAQFYARDRNYKACIWLRSEMQQKYPARPTIDMTNLIIMNLLYGAGRSKRLRSVASEIRDLKTFSLSPNLSTFYILYNSLFQPFANEFILQQLMKFNLPLLPINSEIAYIKHRNGESIGEITDFLNDHDINKGSKLTLKLAELDLKSNGFESSWANLEQLLSTDKLLYLDPTLMEKFVDHFNSIGKPYFAIAFLNYIIAKYSFTPGTFFMDSMFRYLLMTENKHHPNWILFAKYVYITSSKQADYYLKGRLFKVSDSILDGAGSLGDPLTEDELKVMKEITRKLTWKPGKVIVDLDENSEEFKECVNKYFTGIARIY